ncbi:VOC family protein [Actinomadura sp. DC4]|uniref:VOC family protein n=1 Tax=Actinomadura sp. DC4 TaxID=3055069 RepID=UPI0025AFB3A9|nr:VOC family protein [Actinomadura sp. DC4]MDN3357911.1 VOC family protein [Actinomadura sp. DC4]
MSVRELRLVVTTDDYDEAVRFYRDVLGMPQRDAIAGPGGRVAILEAGRATLEIADPVQAEYIDEMEVGRRVAGHIRVALEVDDTEKVTGELTGAGGELIAAPKLGPFKAVTSRMSAPAGLQLSLWSLTDEA